LQASFEKDAGYVWGFYYNEKQARSHGSQGGNSKLGKEGEMKRGKGTKRLALPVVFLYACCNTEFIPQPKAT
jgi:hypothetical protein